MHQGRTRGQWERCEGGGGVVTDHTVLHSACVGSSKLCAKVVLEVSGGGVRVGGGSHWTHSPTRGGGVVTGHTVLHSACVEGSKLCTKVVLEVSGGGVRVGGG